MIRIAITEAVFEAIAAPLPLVSVGYENATKEKGERYVWLERGVVDRLRSLRGPGESYSDVPADRGSEIGGKRLRPTKIAR